MASTDATANIFMESLDKKTQDLLLGIQHAIENGEDPSRSDVEKAFKPMRYHSTIVGVKNHPLRIHVGWDGTVVCVGTAQVQMTAGETDQPWRSMEGDLSRTLLDGYLPVVVTTLERDRLRYEQTVLGHSQDLSPEQPLVALIRVKVSSRDVEDRMARIGFTFQRGLTLWEARDGSSLDLDGPLARDAQRIENESGEIVAWFDTDQEDGVEWKENALTCALLVPGNGSVSVELRLSRNALAPGEIATLESPDFDKALETTRGMWRGFVEKGMSVHSPDPEVSKAFRAWSIYGALLSGLVDGRFEPHDAADFYEHCYGHAAAVYLHTLTFRGDFEEAKRVAATFFYLQRPNGMLSGELEVAHQHGSMLQELCRLYEMSDDREWFGGVISKIKAACEWTVAERGKTMSMLPDGSKPLTYGMLPEHQYCVDKVASFTRAQEYLADALCWAGLNEAAKALSLFGDSESGEKFAAEARAYREDLLSSMRRAAYPDCDPPFLPVVPGREEPYGYLQDTREGAYYSILAPRLLESEIFDSSDEMARWIPQFLEARGGLVLGTADFLADHGIDAHFVYGYALQNLRDDMVGRFLLTYYGFMAHGMSQATFSPPECYYIKGGYGTYATDKHLMEWCNMPQPHLHSLSGMLRMVRMMLVQEDGRTLWLGRATPRDWLEDGKELGVNNAATQFGAVSFRIRSSAASNTIGAVVEFAPRNGPNGVKLRIRHPQAKPLHAVEVDGKQWTAFKDDVVDLGLVEGKVQVIATYA